MQQHGNNKPEEGQRMGGGMRVEQAAVTTAAGGRGRGRGMGMVHGHMAGPQFGWGYGYPMPFFTAGVGAVLRAPMFAQGMGLGMATPRPAFAPDMNNNNNYSHKVSSYSKKGPGATQSHDYSRRGVYGGNRGRGHWYGSGYHRDLLTKEALDADLDQWRMKDKKYVGDSLDAELDEYWRKKIDASEPVKSESEDSSVLEKRDLLDGLMNDVPKRTAESGCSLRPSKTMRST